MRCEKMWYKQDDSPQRQNTRLHRLCSTTVIVWSAARRMECGVSVASHLSNRAGLHAIDLLDVLNVQLLRSFVVAAAFGPRRLVREPLLAFIGLQNVDEARLVFFLRT